MKLVSKHQKSAYIHGLILTKDGGHRMPDGTLLSQGPDRSHIDGGFPDLIVSKIDGSSFEIQQGTMINTIDQLVDVFICNKVNFNLYF